MFFVVCSLSIAVCCYSLFVGDCRLCVCRLSFVFVAVRCLMFVVCCSLFVVCFLLSVIAVVWCALFAVVRCLLLVAMVCCVVFNGW